MAEDPISDSMYSIALGTLERSYEQCTFLMFSYNNDLSNILHNILLWLSRK